MAESAHGISLLDDPHSAYFVHHSDHHGLISITPKLTSTNYSAWNRSFYLALSIRNKLGFIDGTIPQPLVTDKLYMPWIRCNNLIVAWLLESLTPSIASTVFYMSNAAQIWETLKRRFSLPDYVRICNLQHTLNGITQEIISVDLYFTELNFVWEELRSFHPLPKCTCGGFQEFVDQMAKVNIFRFLNGLNDSFSAIRSQIIMMKPFPSLDEAYNLVLREENKRNFHVTVQPLSETAAISVVAGEKSKRKSNFLCSNCGKKGHLKDKCYRLIRFPADYKFNKNKSNGNNKRSQSYSANNVISIAKSNEAGDEGINGSMSQIGLSKDQIHKMLSLINEQPLINQYDTPTISSQ
ncbi:PREDICTED: uncharacterized protein LOC108662467 [Theobroma cacao]|uniref:Uncharacterized protein LOC108662467 n=1 Tax=Theobroma cacao TaxID=3641 RepID=A0AB32WKM3_THECC|nr:PREDICTED: uncharacterized protein LOC108662467 [Theobroma cacao]